MFSVTKVSQVTFCILRDWFSCLFGFHYLEEKKSVFWALLWFFFWKKCGLKRRFYFEFTKICMHGWFACSLFNASRVIESL